MPIEAELREHFGHDEPTLPALAALVRQLLDELNLPESPRRAWLLSKVGLWATALLPADPRVRIEKAATSIRIIGPTADDRLHTSDPAAALDSIRRLVREIQLNRVEPPAAMENLRALARRIDPARDVHVMREPLFDEIRELNVLRDQALGFARCINADPGRWRAAAEKLKAIAIPKDTSTPILDRMRQAKEWIFSRFTRDGWRVDLHGFEDEAARFITLFLALALQRDFDGAALGLGWTWDWTFGGDGREGVTRLPIMFDHGIGGSIYRQRTVEAWKHLANAAARQLGSEARPAGTHTAQLAIRQNAILTPAAALEEASAAHQQHGDTQFLVEVLPTTNGKWTVHAGESKPSDLLGDGVIQHGSGGSDAFLKDGGMLMFRFSGRLDMDAAKARFIELSRAIGAALPSELAAELGLRGEPDGLAFWLVFMLHRLADNPNFIQSGPNWQAIVNPFAAMIAALKLLKADNGAAAKADSADNAWMTHIEIAKHHRVNRERLRKRLERYRASNHNGWKEVDQRAPNEPKYLFHYGSVKAIVLDLKASGETSAERPAK